MDVKKFRRDNSLGQGELARYLGVGQSFISQIEHGSKKMPQEYLQKLLTNDRGWDTTALRDVLPDITEAQHEDMEKLAQKDIILQMQDENLQLRLKIYKLKALLQKYGHICDDI